MKKTSSFFVLVCCALLILSCKKKEGVVDIPQNAPRLLSASIQPTSVHIDSNRIDVDSLGNDTYRIRVNITAEAIDADGAGDIGTTSLVITSPRSITPLLTGIVPQSSVSGDTARFADSVSFVIRRSDAGAITIEFQASDNANLASNALSRSLIVNRNNSEPDIFGLLAPDTLRRPTSGTLLFRMAITATDSDGVADIAEVYFRSINSSNPNLHIQLLDDGNLIASGDSVAGDGRYARILSLPDTVSPGLREFRFWARDFAAAQSDSIIHFVTIIP